MITSANRLYSGRAIILLILAAFCLAGCGRAPDAKPLKKMTIAFQEWVGYGPFYLAKELGYTNDEGIDLVFVNEPLDASRRDAFKAGMLDCEAGTIDLLVSKRAQSTPIQMVMELDESYGADGIVAVKDIRTLADLAGRKVALARDDVGETFLSYLLYEEKLPFDTIEIVPERPDAVAAAFLNGRADAAVTWEPELSRTLVRAGAHLLVTTRERPGIIIDTLNVREDVIQKDPALVRGLMRAWFRALDYYKKHPEEASGIIGMYYGMTPEEYRAAAGGLRWMSYGDQRDPSRRRSWIETFDTIAAVKASFGRLKGKPDAEAAIDSTLLQGLYEDSK